MTADRATQEPLPALRERVAALRAPPCGMAHESIRANAGGPARNPRSPSGYARVGLCPPSVRATHLGCSHTMARHALRDALERLGGEETHALLAELHDLEQAISLLDHRRYDAETRKANAVVAGASEALMSAEHEIAGLIAEHHAYRDRVTRVRDEALRQLDAVIAATA